MRLFLDTAIVSDVEERLPTGLISGITTNPTLIKKSGRDPEDVYRELLNLGVMDLSIEVPGTDCTEFIANGFQAVKDWGSYATVKLPCTVEGLKACKYLEERNSVKPGITGLAQIQGRLDLSLQERLYWDLQYVKSKSFIYDFKIIIKKNRKNK